MGPVPQNDSKAMRVVIILYMELGLVLRATTDLHCSVTGIWFVYIPGVIIRVIPGVSYNTLFLVLLYVLFLVKRCCMTCYVSRLVGYP